jgi:hypothetical protein
MKKLFILLVALLSLSSCSTSFWTGRPKDAVLITDFNQRMTALKDNFPELYNLFKQGKIVIDEMYMYNFKTGNPRVSVDYHHIR